MRTPLPWSGRIALLAFLPAGLLPLLLAAPRAARPVQPQSRFHDWTTHHVVYPQIGTLKALEAARSDPRAMFRWREVEQAQGHPVADFWRRHRHPRPPRRHNDLHTDWNISLGGGSTAPGQFPAKFTFDTTVAPNCVNDFAVFPVNVNGGAAQPNIVAFNNLYSGVTGGVGICNGRATPPGDTDTKTSATVLWSYNVHAIVAGGAVPTSPVLSLDGTRVAFVESAAGNPAHFHVLAWKSGDTNSTNLQTTTSPKAITTFTNPSAPAAGSGTASDLALGLAGTDTLSSPFVDYVRDLAYVGNDAGTLYRIKNVFCTLSTCAGAAPSLDASWGTAGAVTVGCGATLTGPVLDFVTLNVFVGCANGRVYAFNSTGTPLATPSIVVGNGSATGGVVESPIVDGVNGFIYAVSGNNGTNAVLVQAKTDLSAVRTATVGGGGFHNLRAPTFNDPYFSSAAPATWLIYAAAFDATAANLVLYGVTFDVSRNMSIGTPPISRQLILGNRVAEYSPLLEFKNGATDWLFLGVLVTPPDIGRLNINAFPLSVTTASSGNGTSGMVIDNSSASVQASSIYFGTVGTNNAVKLTQSGLQ
jgi:hypothetical protein